MTGLGARGVSVRFGPLQALDDVALRVDPGHAVMLVGPNGAGKSTLIKVLLGLVRPDSAVFEMDGHDMAQILRTTTKALGAKERPKVIIANTIKGKGCSIHGKPGGLARAGAG